VLYYGSARVTDKDIEQHFEPGTAWKRTGCEP
jgi:hypothetical protein